VRSQTTGLVDRVVTPRDAFALIVAEDASDRWFLHWFERYIRNRPARASLLMIFNPSRPVANVAEMPTHGAAGSSDVEVDVRLLVVVAIAYKLFFREPLVIGLRGTIQASRTFRCSTNR
jgi:hypothetical protein